METLPVFVPAIFGFTVLLTVCLFYRAAARNLIVLSICFVWIILQSIISVNGVYLHTNTLPPPFLFALVPPLIAVALAVCTKRGRRWLATVDVKAVTLLSVVRVPVEIVLMLLFANKLAPRSVTLEGSNLDILSGLTAPLVYYFVFAKNRNLRLLLLWNIICLALLLNVVVTAILSAPLPFQRFAFDQPLVAVLYFPFVLLPSFIVPVVLFSHVASIYNIIKLLRTQPASSVLVTD